MSGRLFEKLFKMELPGKRIFGGVCSKEKKTLRF